MDGEVFVRGRVVWAASEGREARRVAETKANPRIRAQMAEFLRRAREGAEAYRWLHDLICRSGYAPIAVGDEQRILVGIRRLAKHLGITRRTLEKWRHEGLPIFRPGIGSRPMLVDVLEAITWRDQRERARRDLEEDPLLLGDGKGYWAEQYRKEKTFEARRHNAIEEGALINAAEVAMRLGEIARRFRDGIEAVGRRHGAAVARDIAVLIDDLTTDLTTGIDLQETPECQEEPEPAAPAAEPARKAPRKPARKPTRKRAAKRARKKRKRPRRASTPAE